MTSTGANPRILRLKRLGLWLTVVLAALCALWTSNLFVFHLWAAYVPPYETALHVRWAKIAAGTALGFAGVAGLASWRLYRGRRRVG